MTGYGYAGKRLWSGKTAKVNQNDFMYVRIEENDR